MKMKMEGTKGSWVSEWVFVAEREKEIEIEERPLMLYRAINFHVKTY
jgi:hypothetical protein